MNKGVTASAALCFCKLSVHQAREIANKQQKLYICTHMHKQSFIYLEVHNCLQQPLYARVRVFKTPGKRFYETRKHVMDLLPIVGFM